MAGAPGNGSAYKNYRKKQSSRQTPSLDPPSAMTEKDEKPTEAEAKPTEETKDQKDKKDAEPELVANPPAEQLTAAIPMHCERVPCVMTLC